MAKFKVTTPKFKVGDKVKLKKTGQVGTITRVTTDFGFTNYWVKGLPGGPTDSPLYAEDRLALANSCALNAAYSNTLKEILESVKPYMDRRIKGDMSWKYPMLVITILRKVCESATMSAGRYDNQRPPHRVYDVECVKNGFKFQGNLIITGLLYRKDDNDVSAFDEYDMTLSLMNVGKATNTSAINATTNPVVANAMKIKSKTDADNDYMDLATRTHNSQAKNAMGGAWSRALSWSVRPKYGKGTRVRVLGHPELDGVRGVVEKTNPNGQVLIVTGHDRDGHPFTEWVHQSYLVRNNSRACNAFTTVEELLKKNGLSREEFEKMKSELNRTGAKSVHFLRGKDGRLRFKADGTTIGNAVASNATSHAPLYIGKAKEVVDRITQNMYHGKAIFGNVYYNPNGPFKWMINSSGWLYVAQPSRLNILGDKRFGWKVFRVEKDGMLKQINYHDFDSVEDAQKAFDGLKTINSVVANALAKNAVEQPELKLSDVTDKFEVGKNYQAPWDRDWFCRVISRTPTSIKVATKSKRDKDWGRREDWVTLRISAKKSIENDCEVAIGQGWEFWASEKA